MFKKLSFITTFFSTPIGAFILAAAVAFAGLFFLLHQRNLEIEKLDAEAVAQEIQIQQQDVVIEETNKATQINDKVTAEAIKEVLVANNETPVKIAKVKNKVDKVKTKYSAYKEKAKTPDETKTISLEEEKELSAVKYAAILEAFDIEDTDTSETKEGEENA